MGRCRTCRNDVVIPAQRELGKALRTWPSYMNLVELAVSGCDLCALFRHYLTNYISERSLRETEGDVRLYGGGGSGDLSIECAPFRGAINIRTTTRSDSAATVSLSKECDELAQAKRWLSRCLADHSSCREQSIAQIDSVDHLPKRLLDLSHEANVVIVNVADWISSGLATASEFSEYCTLSYRWGTTSHDCVLSAHFQTLLEMPLDCMPDTFKDAITVTRDLGIRYLWVDALCIVQPAASGDFSDWQEEGARMGIIYQNALLNISATCADKADDGFLSKVGISENSAVPCKITRHQEEQPPSGASGRSSSRPGRIVTEEVTLPLCKPSFFESVSSSKLNSRGWVVQERALSKRLLHFTEHGLFWECCETKAHHGFGDFDPGQHQGPCRTKETLLSIARARSTRHLCPVEWFHFVRNYSFAGFTDPKDRLVALSSVAKAAQSMLGKGEYCAGVWKADLVRGLMWHAAKPSIERLSSETVAPSWSWASTEGAINFSVLDMDTFSNELVEVIGVDVTPALAANPFGNVRRGKLTLYGRLHRMTLPTINHFSYDPRLVVDWDHEQDTADQQRAYTILPVGASRGSNLYSNLFGALILEAKSYSSAVPSSATPSVVYRRIGWVAYLHSRSSTFESYHLVKENWIKDRGQYIVIE